MRCIPRLAMSNLNQQSILSVHHWTDTLFSFTCTRDPGSALKTASSPWSAWR
ncbi:protein of unknown function (plasmid) [Cupriavidus taiwanensis]|nr:protein of unknown function [Cupriavidus taiwanensis]